MESLQQALQGFFVLKLKNEKKEECLISIAHAARGFIQSISTSTLYILSRFRNVGAVQKVLSCRICFSIYTISRFMDSKTHEHSWCAVVAQRSE